MSDPNDITRSDAGCWFGAMLIVLGIVAVGFVVLCWMTGPGRAGPVFSHGIPQRTDRLRIPEASMGRHPTLPLRLRESLGTQPRDGLGRNTVPIALSLPQFEDSRNGGITAPDGFRHHRRLRPSKGK